MFEFKLRVVKEMDVIEERDGIPPFKLARVVSDMIKKYPDENYNIWIGDAKQT